MTSVDPNENVTALLSAGARVFNDPPHPQTIPAPLRSGGVGGEVELAVFVFKVSRKTLVKSHWRKEKKTLKVWVGKNTQI